ncbi:galactonate dehydratase [Conexibacter arvalis]|uniref:galactonate dehydratase n=1 Tax=Conexibacter arvalis TaxID=912552 RepID=UPI001C848921
MHDSPAELLDGELATTNVRIVDVDAVVVGAELRNWVFVKITTSEPGLVGWGEATLEWKTQAVVGALRDLAPLLRGRDPTRIEHLWQSQYRHPFFKGGAVTMSAISGIDQALWDIKGKLLGVPVWQLLGGAVRDRVRMYDHLGAGDASVVYGAATGEGFAAAARRSVADGFDAVKILAVPVGGPLPTTTQLDDARAVMGAVRDAVGDAVEIMVDFHGRTTPRGALMYADALADLRPWFIEEPCQPEDVSGMVEVARRSPAPVATGERLIVRAEFRDLLAARAAAVIQPDVCHVGGISGLTKIASLAETWQVPIAPHNPLGPVATWANLHLDFATPNFLVQEIMRADVPWRADVVSAVPEIADGHVALPTAPGLGVEVVEEAAREHPYRHEPQLGTVLADGSVADW